MMHIQLPKYRPVLFKMKMKHFCLFNIRVAVLLLSTVGVAMNESSTDEDAQALAAFKTTIISNTNQILMKNWSSDVSVCSWIGVTCSVRHPRVTSLNFSGFGFQGTLVPDLGNLTFLRSLDLSNNSFTGLILRELSKLRRLEVIDVRFNGFVGQIPSWLGATGDELESILLNNNNFSGSIPPSLGNNTKLQILNLSYNFLDGIIPLEMGNLSFLRILDVRNNGQISGSIPGSIFNLSRIEVIALSGNSLSGTLTNNMCGDITRLSGLYLSRNLISGQIPFQIHKCNELQDLVLSYNHFNGTIPTSIGSLTNLRVLYLDVNTFRGGVPMEIGNLSRLEVLSIQGGSLSGQIPSFIFNMSSLITLDLSNNSLSGSVETNICRSFPKLEQIDLNTNNLTGQILDYIYDCPTLFILVLSYNEFTGHIPKHVGNLTSLNYLNLHDNYFTGEVPAELGNLNLVEIILHTNMLSGAIPLSIFNISSIEIIELSINKFSGKLPSTLGISLPNLQMLILSDNKLSGQIPASITNASILTLIGLGTNSFTGSVPNFGSLKLLSRLLLGENNLTAEFPNQEMRFITWLTNCRLMQVVELSLNQLHGMLPSSIGNFSDALLVFRAFGNGITGSIPAGIGNLTTLQDLYLDSNELTGFIPNTLGKLSQLVRVYLEYNMLQGLIPSDLCQLSRLGDIYVSSNRLHGPIPMCIGEMKSLRRLYLDSNLLESSVPSGLWGLTNLLELNLSSNVLNGILPSEVGDLSVIGVLDLSWNQFSGYIPSSIGNAESLVTLSLAHNNFESSIPQSIGSLKGLEFLDLSFNGLSGIIPNSLEELDFLQYFKSYNRLEGPIPAGGSFANFTAQSFVNNSGLCGAPRLQVSPCRGRPNEARSNNVGSLMKYVVPPCVLTLVVVLLACLVRRSSRQSQDTEVSLLPSWRGSSYTELQRATNAFSEGNLLGRGSFGSVFVGTLSDGLIVAVKVFNLHSSEEVAKSFDTETQVLRTIRHRNLIKVIGCCSNLDFKALVYEYMPNGSLEKWLYSHNNFLELLQRLNIAIDVASALEYLHHGLTTPVVHLDLKPSNIMLDGDMTAYVGDFGIAKIFGEGTLIAQTETLATVGYMAPEYGAQGIVTTSADVYSFGVVVLEMFTRKKPTDEMFGEEMSLKEWVSHSLHESTMTNVVDANLIGREDNNFLKKEQCSSSVLSLAMECLVFSPSDRIKMSEVVASLKKIKTMFLANTVN